MALQEEYEYAAFRCAFCNFFNPAKKLRPLAPRLPSEMTPAVHIQRPSTSSSESSSGLKNFHSYSFDRFNHFQLLLSDSDNEISKKKLSNVTEANEKEAAITTKHSDIESESATEDIEIIDKPERSDIEKKLE